MFSRFVNIVFGEICPIFFPRNIVSYLNERKETKRLNYLLMRWIQEKKQLLSVKARSEMFSRLLLNEVINETTSHSLRIH